ncbi:MAG: TIGR03943 family putative permease subunit [Patescibacteria group bacterium]
MSKIYQYLMLIAFGSYSIYLYSIRRLTYLISERYIWLSLAGGVVLMLVGVFGLYNSIAKDKFVFKFSKKSINLNLLCFVLVCLTFLIPLRTLSSESFNIRSANNAFKVSESEKSKIQEKISFAVDTNQFTLYDWVKARALNDNSLFKDKEFTATGFITPTKIKNQFVLSRFVVACCVVDATPTGMLIEYDYESKSLVANDWLEVKGKFEILSIEGVSQPVVIPNKVEKIQQPDDIYLNRI